MTAAWEKSPNWWKGERVEDERPPLFMAGGCYDLSEYGRISAFRDEYGDSRYRLGHLIDRGDKVTFCCAYCLGPLTDCPVFPANLRPPDWETGRYIVFRGMPREFDIMGMMFVVLLSEYDTW